MTDLLERVRATALLPEGTPVLVLLSGGRDSVCLLDVAVRLAGAQAVGALHVNYGLRDTADDDEAHCVTLCARLGVTLDVRRPLRPEGSGNLQAWARDQRLAAAAQLAVARGARVATGHTATDQVETVLYRLAASPGRRALLGMRARDGRLVRPLLGVGREETAAHNRSRGLDWREDPTNDSGAFARGRVRNGLLAGLRAVHPAAEANVLRTLEVLRDEAEVLDAALTPALAAAGSARAGHAVQALAALPPALRRLAVQRLADDAAGAGRAPAVGARAAEILGLAPAGGSAALDLGGGLRAVVEYGRLRMTTDASGPEPAAAALAVPGRAAYGAGELSSERGPDLPLGDGTLDAAALAPPLEVRPWRAGDRMRPLGLGGAAKTLQDLFVDRRVPKASRGAIPVVLSGGEIAWVPGVATGEDFRVTPETRERVRLAWHPWPWSTEA